MSAPSIRFTKSSAFKCPNMFTVGPSAEPSRLLIVKLTASFLEIGIFYQFPQFFQCKKTVRFDCRYRPPRNLRDLFIADLFVNPQLEDCLLFRWKLFDHAAECSRCSRSSSWDWTDARMLPTASVTSTNSC